MLALFLLLLVRVLSSLLFGLILGTLFEPLLAEYGLLASILELFLGLGRLIRLTLGRVGFGLLGFLGLLDL